MPTLQRPDADALRDDITTCRNAVRVHAAGLDRSNVYPVPDGDTGTTRRAPSTRSWSRWRVRTGHRFEPEGAGRR